MQERVCVRNCSAGDRWYAIGENGVEHRLAYLTIVAFMEQVITASARRQPAGS